MRGLFAFKLLQFAFEARQVELQDALAMRRLFRRDLQPPPCPQLVAQEDVRQGCDAEVKAEREDAERRGRLPPCRLEVNTK